MTVWKRICAIDGELIANVFRNSSRSIYAVTGNVRSLPTQIRIFLGYYKGLKYPYLVFVTRT